MMEYFQPKPTYNTQTVAAVNPFFSTFALKFIDKDKCEGIKHLAFYQV